MIALRISVRVDDERRPDLERTYLEVFLPALRRQAGFRGSTLYRSFPEHIAREINAAESADYEIELRFDTEAARRAWVGSDDHASAWPQIRGLAAGVGHVGYDVLVTETLELLAGVESGSGS